MGFEFDEDKARSNEATHGVTFDEAETVFDDPLMAIAQDPFHSEDEARFIAIGESLAQRVLVVSFAERGDNIRIISARVCTDRERKTYEESE